ncbi:MAG TPA: hypothetical protein VMT53_19715 [Terriglobales bacterium]|nr:hypothetical protein [Terriglobales bacterium]
MSTVANTKQNSGSASATVFIAAIVMCAAAMAVDGYFRATSWHFLEFPGLVLVSTVTARLKVKLPGVNSNMSVSMPFLFIAMTRLSLPEMLITAAASVLTQSVPKAPHKFNPVHALFNVSTGVLATGLGWEAFHRATAVRANSTACLLAGCVAYLFASTLPVAGIISLTDNHKPFHTWSEIMHLSFPYYVASAGLASIAMSVAENTTWPLLVGMSLVTFVMYNSYRRYFGMTSSAMLSPASTETAKSKSAAAGQ